MFANFNASLAALSSFLNTPLRPQQMKKQLYILLVPSSAFSLLNDVFVRSCRLPIHHPLRVAKNSRHQVNKHHSNSLRCLSHQPHLRNQRVNQMHQLKSNENQQTPETFFSQNESSTKKNKIRINIRKSKRKAKLIFIFFKNQEEKSYTENVYVTVPSPGQKKIISKFIRVKKVPRRKKLSNARKNFKLHKKNFEKSSENLI